MSEKKCSKCCEIKPLDEFLWRNKSKNQKHSVCRICYKELRKKSYINNSEYYKNKSKKRRIEHSILYEEYKKNCFCKILFLIVRMALGFGMTFTPLASSFSKASILTASISMVSASKSFPNS